MMAEAVTQYGAERVGRYLELPGDILPSMGARELLAKKVGMRATANVSGVFRRFLSYLRYVELAGSLESVPEMAWFPAG